MAGKRQHYLPRFLLKGFKSRDNVKGFYTWVFKNGNKPYEANIINVGTEQYFYGEPDLWSIDDVITDKESEFAPILDDLRKCTSDISVPQTQISELIIHLITRTRHLRLSLEELVNSFLNIIQEYVGSQKKLSDLLLAFIRENPNEFRRLMKKSFAENGLVNPPPEVFEFAVQMAYRQAPMLSRSPSFLGMHLGLREGFKQLRSDMPKLIERTHLRALSKDTVPPALINRISGLQWNVLVKPSRSFILGDAGPLAMQERTGEVKALFLLDDDDVSQIFLPISDCHVLIGSRKGETSYSIDSLNFCSASFCKEFFISAELSASCLGYQKYIGMRSSLFSEAELRKLEQTFIKSLLEDSDSS